MRRELGRDLLGVDDAQRPTGEYALLRAVEEGDLATVRAAVARKQNPLVGKDLLALVTAHLAANEQKQFIRYPVDVPARVWHEAARSGRTEGRSFRSVLTDYLTRGWEEYTQQRRQADTPREALSAELRRFRSAIEEASVRPATIEPEANAPAITTQLAEITATLRRLEESDRARSNALVAIVSALHEHKWIPKAMLRQLQQDGWLG